MAKCANSCSRTAQVGQRDAVLAGGFGPAAFGDCAAGARRSGLAAAAALDVERGRRRPADAVAMWCAVCGDQLRLVDWHAGMLGGKGVASWRMSVLGLRQPNVGEGRLLVCYMDSRGRCSSGAVRVICYYRVSCRGAAPCRNGSNRGME